MSAGRSEDRLQRVERASSEIAIDDPQRGERRCRCGLTCMARQCRVVCVDDVGCHRSWSPCAGADLLVHEVATALPELMKEAFIQRIIGHLSLIHISEPTRPY